MGLIDTELVWMLVPRSWSFSFFLPGGNFIFFSSCFISKLKLQFYFTTDLAILTSFIFLPHDSLGYFKTIYLTVKNPSSQLCDPNGGAVRGGRDAALLGAHLRRVRPRGGHQGGRRIPKGGSNLFLEIWLLISFLVVSNTCLLLDNLLNAKLV